MDDVYMLTDATIQCRLGENLKGVRLKQNITQQRLAEEAGVSLSTLKKVEKGEIGSFDAFLRILRCPPPQKGCRSAGCGKGQG